MMATAAQVNQRKRSGSSPKKPDDDSSSVIMMSANDERDVDARIEEYREIVGDPASWADCRTLEQVRYEIYKTRLAARDDAKAKGYYMTREEVEAANDIADVIIFSNLDSVMALVGELVPPESAVEARRKAQDWITSTKRNIADKLRESRRS
jgi:hypothetical protein